MKWVEVYDDERDGLRKVIGYVCNRCGFFTRHKYKGGCPFCKRPELEE
jgi:rubrerythrin